MSIELTPSQQRELDRSSERPQGVRDPRSKAEYVLLPKEQYEQMVEVIEDDLEQRALRRAGARALARRLADQQE
jgi:hypothetical protein